MQIVDIPALLIGVMATFYWGRVIKLVFKTRRLTGKAANFFPPEKLGALLRIVWYPTVVLWIVVPLVHGFRSPPLRSGLFEYFWWNPLARWGAVAVAFVAWYFTLICWRKMGRDWRMGIDPAEKNTLIVTGPYAYARHPIYALSSLLMLASFVAVPSGMMLILAGVHLLFLQWEARREERHMASVHGATYVDYMRQVGRFVPRGRYRPAASVPA
ncbi:MAG TPA: isoprenylcysteine carboxylmethyltransferase family protein [Tepidisphaeraceae bacterium]|jgi:protein-S-isoprenylcysteine O-methyltransferase Ste14